MYQNKSIRFYTLLFLLFPSFFFKVHAQLTAESVKHSTVTIGNSAISINTIQAHRMDFEFPIREYAYDSVTKLFFVSGSQKNEQYSQSMQRNFFAAVDDKTEKIKWFNESSLSRLDLVSSQLILSNENRSVRFNKSAGYDEIHYPAKMHFFIPGTNLGLAYSKGSLDTVLCVEMKSGEILWKAPLSGNEDWVDYCMLDSSTLLIAAAGIHAFNIQKGLLWFQPLETSKLTNKSLVYSLMKSKTLESVSKVVHTSTDENIVSQLASNIFVNNNKVFIAAHNKCLALDKNGNEIWSQDLRNYPASKMLLAANDSELVLVNFGLALHSNRFINWGKPFMITLDPDNGNIIHQYDLSKIENLADYIKIGNDLVFAGKDEIVKASPGEDELRSVLNLSESKYGKFTEFINGNEFYAFKEGYYVPLNFINDNLIYFKTDNNKIYGIDGDIIQYEYHFTDLYQLKAKHQGKTILSNGKSMLITSVNFELLFELNISDPLVFSDDKIYFIGENSLTILNMADLK
jgi:outer membrane protein assembly factor BamB